MIRLFVFILCLSVFSDIGFFDYYTVEANRIKFDKLLIADIEEMVRKNPDYNPIEHPHQIIPMSFLRNRERQRSGSFWWCRTCTLDFNSKPETIYELALEDSPFNRREEDGGGRTRRLSREDQLEGIIIPFKMPTLRGRR